MTEQATAAAATAGGHGIPSRAGPTEWRLVGALTLMAVLNYVDRGGIALIVNPIKADLHVSDVQISLLLGLSFIALYSLCSIPAGHLADLISRRLIVFGSVLFWSCAMALSGLANSYAQLFAGRMALGVGEAALPPAAYSLLRDGVPEERRGRAFSIYAMGGSLGLGLGALVAGGLYDIGTKGAFAGVPLLNHLKPWQLALTIPGLCGIPIAFVMLIIREPPRTATTDSDAATFAEVIRYVGKHWRVYAPIVGSATVALLALGGWSAWLPAAIGRKWGLAPPPIAHVVGLMTLILSPLNNLVIGVLMDHFSKGSRPEAYLRVPMVAYMLNLAPAMLILFAPTLGSMWLFYGLSLLINSSTLPIAGAALATITPSRLMGKVTSLYFMIANLLGFAVAPTIFALVSAWFFKGPLAIVKAMTVCYPTMLVSAILLFWIASVQIKRWQRTARAAGSQAAG